MLKFTSVRSYTLSDLNLDLSASGGDQAPWLMLLGENGTGKSSVLHAIALALMGTKYRSLLDELDARKYVRHRARKGWVRVYLTGSKAPIELSFRSNSRLFDSHPREPKLLLLGYGATRLLPRGNSMAPANVLPYARIENLFNPFVPLVDATDWLLNLPDETFQHIARALKELLSLENESMLAQVRGSHRRIEVRAFGDRFTLNELSDGYQSVLALATDIMAVMLDRWPAMEVAEGIVLLDEIGAHLHPRWKMRIVNTLRQVFPRVQFIASTHSPLCLRGLGDGEIVVMRRDGQERIIALADLPPVEGLRIDQLLTSEHFGLNSTVDPDIEEQFQEYYRLLAKPDLSNEERSSLKTLKTELEVLDQMGSTRRERLMLEAVDEYLAQKPELLTSEKREHMKATTRKKVAEIWDHIDMREKP